MAIKGYQDGYQKPGYQDLVDVTITPFPRVVVATAVTLTSSRAVSVTLNGEEAR